GEAPELRHFEKGVHGQVDSELPAGADIAQAYGLVRNAGPKGDQPAGTDGYRPASEGVVDRGRRQPVEPDMAVAMRGGHDLRREGAHAEAAEGLARGIEIAIRTRRGAGRPGLNRTRMDAVHAGAIS